MTNKITNLNHEKQDKKILIYNPAEYRSRNPKNTYHNPSNEASSAPVTFGDKKRIFYDGLAKSDDDISQEPRRTSTFGSLLMWFILFICIYSIFKRLGF